MGDLLTRALREPVMRALMDAFGHQRGSRTERGYYETSPGEPSSGDHNFRLGPRANIYVRKMASQPNGVQPYVRFIPTALENFPNGSQLRATSRETTSHTMGVTTESTLSI